MNMAVRCAECECAPEECGLNGQCDKSIRSCPNCKADSCCCISVHLTEKGNQCCDDTSCKNADLTSSGRGTSPVFPHKKAQRGFGLWRFFLYAKGLYAAALGIEILCIAAAEIGENTGLYLFGFNLWGIIIAYAMGYALAGFTTFITILGRYNHIQQSVKGTQKIDSCCSVLEQGSKRGFLSNLKTTFTNFAFGFKSLLKMRKQKGLSMILKSSLFILVTAESVCILTAETVDLIFYQYSLLLSVPLALLAGAFTVVVPAPYRRVKQSGTNPVLQ